nr:LysR family substrate-binding domain-containing protein [Pseudoroseomonas coralli]
MRSCAPRRTDRPFRLRGAQDRFSVSPPWNFASCAVSAIPSALPRKGNSAAPPLAAPVQALEAELGVKPLERTCEGARARRAGEALPLLARRQAEDAGTLQALAHELRAERPEAAIIVRELDTTDALEALRRGEVDIALLRPGRDRPPGRVLPLGEDHLVAALPEDHPLLAQPAPLPLAALMEEPLPFLPRAISPACFDSLVAACRAAGFGPRGVREAGSAMAQLSFVASRLGVALVSSGTARMHPAGVVFRPLHGPIRAVSVALGWNEERQSEAACGAVALAGRVFARPPH